MNGKLKEALIGKILGKRLLSEIEKFRDLHKGETCYVFGDGPSLKWFDITKFSDHPAICCGVLPFHKDFQKLDVRYCMLAEPWFFVPKFLQATRLHATRTIAAEYKKFIQRTPDKEFFVSLSNMFSVSGENVNYVYRGLPKNRNPTDVLLGQFDLFSGSFHASLTLAYYLGFSKIYLIGFDGWTIQPARALHWYEVGQGVFFEPTNLATEFLDILKTEVDIYTISVDGASKNVTNVSYETYTGNPPEFRENHELITKHYMDVMATFPEYKIFP